MSVLETSAGEAGAPNPRDESRLVQLGSVDLHGQRCEVDGAPDHLREPGPSRRIPEGPEQQSDQMSEVTLHAWHLRAVYVACEWCSKSGGEKPPRG